MTLLLSCPIFAFAQQNTPQAATAQKGDSASVVIVLDNSRRARGSFKELRQAAATLVDAFEAKDEVALYTTGDKAALAQDFTGDSTLLKQQLGKIKPSGKPALRDAVVQAIGHARSDAANEQIAVVALVSDFKPDELAKIAGLEAGQQQSTPVRLYVAAVGRNNLQAQEAAQRIAVVSGGAAFFPSREKDMRAATDLIAARLGAEPESGKAKDESSEASLRDYNVVMVHDIPVSENKNTAALGGGENELLQNVLVARLKKAKVFAEVRDASGMGEAASTPVSSSDPNEAQGEKQRLDVYPMVVSYKGGVRGPKDWISPFASPRLTIQVVLRDGSTHEPISAFTEEASGARGLLRGSDDKVQAQAILGVADKIVAKLKRMKAEKR